MEIYLDKYTLNLNLLKTENDKTREFVQSIYHEMITLYRDFCQGHYNSNSKKVNIDLVMLAHFNTLYYNGYLSDIRDIKLEEILKK